MSREKVIEKYNQYVAHGTPLIVACEEGILEDVKVLLTAENKNELGYTINKQKITPLFCAVDNEHEMVVKYLLEQDVDLTYHDKALKDNVLHIAAVNETTEIMTMLILRAGDMLKNMINDINILGNTPLDIAIMEENNCMVSLLRGSGGKGNWHDKNNIFVGRGKGDIFDERNELIMRYKDKFKRATPLIVACEEGNLNDVIILISKKNKDEANYGYTYNYYTPLMAAATFEHVDVLTFLVGYGVDVGKVVDGMNVLHWVAEYNKNIDTVTFLINIVTEADLSLTNDQQHTPYDIAIKYNSNPDIAKLLLGANMEEELFPNIKF